TEQVDAMRALGADPVKKLVVPKVVATVIVLPLLTTLAIILGIFGGSVISAIELNISFSFYWNSVLRTVGMGDFLSGVGKTVVFGYLIAVIGCFNGFRTRGGAVGVGRATTTTVVAISLTVMVSDFFLTKLFLLFETR
ncbi:MAG: ABC transporter permease, partial [Candidatus Methylomirabilis sp.]|nr:ABC transporter permease [Deltaproteobacteria bacterium]